MVKIAVILAGRYRKRLRPLTNDKPKPLVEVAGRPILGVANIMAKKLWY